MKRLLAILILIKISVFSIGQISAITEDGQRVILFNDFTWKYADKEENHSKESGISKIDIGSDGLVRIDFWINGERMSFYDGKVFFGHVQPGKIEYHQNTIFPKSLGKIKEIDFHNISISFEYHHNSAFPKSEGKISSISFGNTSYEFEYHRNSIFPESEGKVKTISSGRYSVNFEYHQNSSFPETVGKLKEISGEIPGVKIRYLE